MSINIVLLYPSHGHLFCQFLRLFPGYNGKAKQMQQRQINLPSGNIYYLVLYSNLLITDVDETITCQVFLSLLAITLSGLNIFPICRNFLAVLFLLVQRERRRERERPCSHRSQRYKILVNCKPVVLEIYFNVCFS